MSKAIQLIGTTALMATMCDPDVLPSAIVNPKGLRQRPFCMHSLRTEGIGFFDQFVAYGREAADVKVGDASKDDELAFELWPFYEDFPEQGYTCTGCAHGKLTEAHHIRESNKACSKSALDCA